MSDNVIKLPEPPKPEKLTKLRAWCTKCGLSEDVSTQPTFARAWINGHGHMCNCYKKDIA